MRGDKFNFIEIIPIYPNKEPFMISILWRGAKFLDFISDGSLSCSKKFKRFILIKKKSQFKSLMVFYISNLEFLLPSILYLRDDNRDGNLEDVEFLIIGNRVYFIKIRIGDS